MEMGQTYGGELLPEVGTTPENTPKIDSDSVLDETTTESPKEENVQNDAETMAKPPENTLSEDENEAVNTSPAVREPSVSFPEGEATSSANFFARVFTAENAYPVEGAKVVVYRADNIYAFIETDSEGKTKTVKLPAFEKSNSLDKDNIYQSIDYFADVFAVGFTPQKGLQVSAVGGSDMVLNVILIPEEEGLS